MDSKGKRVHQVHSSVFVEKTTETRVVFQYKGSSTCAPVALFFSSPSAVALALVSVVAAVVVVELCGH